MIELQNLTEKRAGKRLIVVGGGTAGMSAAAQARKMDPDLEILVFERTAHIAYNACGIPYFISNLVPEAEKLMYTTVEQLQVQRDIFTFTRHQVTRIERKSQEVVVTDVETQRNTRIGYDRLVLATGASPVLPEIPGALSRNVFLVRSLDQGIELKNEIEKNRPRKAVIIGGGFMAFQLAEALRDRNLNVTMLTRSDRLLGGLHSEITDVLLEELERYNITLYRNVGIRGMASEGDEDVTRVMIRDEPYTIPADLVVIATGVRPNVGVAEHGGMRMGKTGAISVNWRMQTNCDEIYAAGECVETRHLVSGKQIYRPLASTARRQGRVAGENAAGGYSTFPGVVGTAAIRIINMEVATTGLNLDEAKEVGISPIMTTTRGNTRESYHPHNAPVIVSIVADSRTGRVIGAQMAGRTGVAKRIDVFATAIYNKMSLEDMQGLDLSFAPPVAPVSDPVLFAVNSTLTQLRKR